MGASPGGGGAAPACLQRSSSASAPAAPAPPRPPARGVRVVVGGGGAQCSAASPVVRGRTRSGESPDGSSGTAARSAPLEEPRPSPTAGSHRAAPRNAEKVAAETAAAQPREMWGASFHRASPQPLQALKAADIGQLKSPKSLKRQEISNKGDALSEVLSWDVAVKKNRYREQTEQEIQKNPSFKYNRLENYRIF